MSTDGDGFLSSLRAIPLPDDFAPPSFDCGEPDLTDYLCDGAAAADQRVGFARCYLVTLPDGRLGVDRAFRGRQVGTWILDYVVGLARALATERVGVRYVTLDALGRASLVAWYKRYGFVPNEGEADRQVALLKFLKRLRPGELLELTSMRFDILLQEEVSPE